MFVAVLSERRYKRTGVGISNTKRDRCPGPIGRLELPDCRTGENNSIKRRVHVGLKMMMDVTHTPGRELSHQPLALSTGKV